MYGYAVLDLTDPSEPELLGRSHAGMLRFPKFIEARGEVGFITYGGLVVVDLDDVDLRSPGTPGVVSRVAVPGIASSVTVRGDFAYLTSDHAGFFVIDLTDLESPTVAGSVELTGFSYDLALEADHVFLGNRNVLQVVDVSEPTDPVLLASLDTPDEVYDVNVHGAYAYLAEGTSGLLVVDIGNPEAPSIAGSLDLSGFVRSVALRGDFAYVADEDFGVRKIDISDPTAPRLVASFATPGEPTDVAIYGEDYVVVNDAFSIIVLR
jgi:hypothetical protein